MAGRPQYCTSSSVWALAVGPPACTGQRERRKHRDTLAAVAGARARPALLIEGSFGVARPTGNGTVHITKMERVSIGALRAVRLTEPVCVGAVCASGPSFAPLRSRRRRTLLRVAPLELQVSMRSKRDVHHDAHCPHMASAQPQERLAIFLCHPLLPTLAVAPHLCAVTEKWTRSVQPGRGTSTQICTLRYLRHRCLISSDPRCRSHRPLCCHHCDQQHTGHHDLRSRQSYHLRRSRRRQKHRVLRRQHAVSPQRGNRCPKHRAVREAYPAAAFRGLASLLRAQKVLRHQCSQ